MKRMGKSKSSGNYKRIKKEIVRVLGDESPLSTIELKERLINNIKLKNSRICSNRIGQIMRQKEFTRHSYLPNKISLWELKEE